MGNAWLDDNNEDPEGSLFNNEPDEVEAEKEVGGVKVVDVIVGDEGVSNGDEALVKEIDDVWLCRETGTG